MTEDSKVYTLSVTAPNWRSIEPIVLITEPNWLRLQLTRRTSAPTMRR